MRTVRGRGRCAAFRGTTSVVIALAWVVVTVGGLVACGRPSSAPRDDPQRMSRGPTVAITLGIYSGRPDPTWTLADADAAALAAALAKLPVRTGAVADRGLGYHGFTIESGGDTRIAVAGAVTTVGPTTDNVLVDPTRTIERLLLNTGRPHLAPAEYDLVRRALA